MRACYWRHPRKINHLLNVSEELAGTIGKTLPPSDSHFDSERSQISSTKPRKPPAIVPTLLDWSSPPSCRGFLLDQCTHILGNSSEHLPVPLAGSVNRPRQIESRIDRSSCPSSIPCVRGALVLECPEHLLVTPGPQSSRGVAPCRKHAGNSRTCWHRRPSPLDPVEQPSPDANTAPIRLMGYRSAGRHPCQTAS